MNILFSLWNLLPFLDIAITPRSTATPTPLADPVVTPVPTQAASGIPGTLLIVLIIFLIFIGILIWKTLKKKK